MGRFIVIGVIGVLLGIPMFEIWLGGLVAERIGGWETVYLLALDFVVGIAIAQAKSRRAILKVQASIAARRSMDPAILRDGLGVLGGILIALPGFASDVVGLLLLAPGSRSLAARFLRKFVEKLMQSGRARTFGGGAGFVFRSGMPTSDEARDVSQTVIDVAPILSERNWPSRQD